MLEEMGLEFEVMAADIDEKAIRLDDPPELVLAIAKAKAQALRPKISEPAILITSDTVVVCDGKILEKPVTEQEAREFLNNYAILPGKTVTAVVVTNLETGKQVSTVDIATVYFHPFSKNEVDDLIEEGRVYALAGALAIDGEKFESHVKKIIGTRDSVIGLSKDSTARLIKEVSEQ